MLVLFDGSRHAWLGECGPWLSLLAAIDDAPGKLIDVVLCEQKELEITSIAARSPQAKGCGETLWNRCPIAWSSNSAKPGASTREQDNEVLQAYLPRAD
jgi:hypothetical protein